MGCYKLRRKSANDKYVDVRIDGEIQKYETEAQAKVASEKLKYNTLKDFPDFYVYNNQYLNEKSLKQFFLNDYMHSLAYNDLIYGDVSIGHKDPVTVVKRNGNIPSDGPSTGFGKTRTAVIESKSINIDVNGITNDVDNQDAQTYANPMWYLQKYLSTNSKLDDRVKDIYFNYILPGVPLPSEELKYLKSVNADLTQRKMVVRNHFDLVKTSFFILSREDTSYLKDPNTNTQEITDLYRQLFNAKTLEEKRGIVERIHSYYLPIKGKEYLHDMLNSQEINDLGFMFVDSAGKLNRLNTGKYQEGKFLIQPYEISDYFIRENVKTDNKPSDVTDSSQTQGLIFNEQEGNQKLTFRVKDKEVTVTLRDLIESFFKLQGERGAIAISKTLNNTIDVLNTKWDVIVDKILAQSHKAQVTDSIASMIQIAEEGGKPKVSLSNNLISKDLESALMTSLSKSLRLRVAGKSYTLLSSEGRNVIVSKSGRIISQPEYRDSPNTFKDYSTRRLEFGKKSNRKGVYYAEVIVSQDVLDKLGIDLQGPERDTMFGLGVRIPTEGKHSMVVLKIVDVLPSTYSSSIVLPPEVILFSGADFDIDKLFVQHFQLTKDKRKFGDYITIDDQEQRYRRAFDEFIEENKNYDKIGVEFIKEYGSIIDANYKNFKKGSLNITPITQAEASNLILDLKMVMSYNDYNENQVKYPSSFALWKKVVIDNFLKDLGLVDSSDEAILGIASAVDKILSQNSNDVGGDNIGLAATSNIMYALLDYYKINGPYLFGQQTDFHSSKEIDLNDNTLDSLGLTIDGKIRKSAVIATIIAMMTDNAKEQLAAKLNLDKKNLKEYLVGIMIGFNPKTLSALNSKNLRKQINRQLAVASFALRDYMPFIISALQTNTVENLDLPKDFADLKKELLNINSIEDALNVFLDKKSKPDKLLAAALHIKSFRDYSKKLNGKLFKLNTIRSLVKGLKSEFSYIDDVYSAMDDLGIFLDERKGVNKNVNKRYEFKAQNGKVVFYYRPELGKSGVYYYELSSVNDLGKIIVNNFDLAQKLSTAIVHDKIINRNTHLKRTDAVRSLGIKETNTFTAYLDSRAYYEGREKFIAANGQNSQAVALRDLIESYDVIFADTGQKTIIEHLHAKLSESGSPYKNNRFLQSIFFTRTPSTRYKDKDVVQVNTNTVSEMTADLKEFLIEKYEELLQAPLNKTVEEAPGQFRAKTIAEIYNTPIAELSYQEAAHLLALKLDSYSYIVNNNSFARNSISTILSDTILEQYYNKLNPVEDLMFKYNDISNSAAFNKEFEEIFGVDYFTFFHDFLFVSYLKGENLYLKNPNYSALGALQPQFQSEMVSGTTKDGKAVSINMNSVSFVDLRLPRDKEKIDEHEALHGNDFYIKEDGYTILPVTDDGILTSVIQEQGDNLVQYIFDISTGKKFKRNVSIEKGNVKGLTDAVEVDRLPSQGVAATYKDVRMANYDSQIKTALSYSVFAKKMAAVKGDKQPTAQPSKQKPKAEQQQSSYQITTTNYTKDTAPNNPDVGYVFTENAEMLDTNKNVSMTQAVIRTDRNGNKNPNALPIITKKLQVAGGQWTNSEEDFNEFKRLNTELIDRIKNSGYSKIVFPPGFATDKAKMPTRFAEWLQQALLNNFGLVTELNATKTGLVSKSIQKQSKAEISSNATGLEAALTNPTELAKSKGNLTESYPIKFNDTDYKDVEEAYQALKDDSEATTKPSQQKSGNYKLMVDLITAKLQQHPRLVSAINKKGGIDWISSATHQPTKKNTVWETGGQNWFIKALADAYRNVSTQPTEQQQPAPPVKKKRGFMNIGGFAADALMNPIEMLNTLLVRYQVAGAIPLSQATNLFNDIEAYNNNLGYEALVAYQDGMSMKITSNYAGEQRAKTSINTVFDILEKLSKRFNIPYVIDYTLKGKGLFMNNKVYINPNNMTDDTAFHEFAHPFIGAIKLNNRPLYNQLLAEIKAEKTILAKTEKLYKNYFLNKGMSERQANAAVLEEAIVQAVGEYAADASKLMDKSPSLFEAIKEFFDYIKQSIKQLFNKGRINIENLPNDTTIKELAIILASDIPITNNSRLSREVVDVLSQIDRCL